VLEAVELPAGVADLDPGLADVDADDLSHLARPSVLPLLAPLAAAASSFGRALPLSLSPLSKMCEIGR
jgi:hypothetical protein